MEQSLAPQIAAFADDPGPVVVIDHSGFIVFMNTAAEGLVGVGLEDLGGESVELLLPEKLRFGHQAYRRGYLAEPSDREMDPGLEPALQRLSDDRIIPIHIRLEPVRVDGTLFVAAHVTPLEDV